MKRMLPLLISCLLLLTGCVSASRNSVLAKPSLPVRESFHVVGVYF